jgi:hypothetical protein
VRASFALIAATLALVSLAVPARGHVTGSFAHLWNDHILPLIQPADANVNQASDPISWTKLRNVPAGFADGSDNGLKKVQHTADLTGVGGSAFPLGVDTGRIQRRVNSFCSIGSAIQRIDQGGTVACSAGGFAAGKFRDGDVDLPGNPARLTVASLNLGAGAWLVMAKAIPYGFQNSSWAVTCRLETGVDFDEATTGMSGASFNASMQLSLMVLRSSSSSFTAALRCGEFHGNAHITWVKIIALRLGSFTNSAQT